jgi:hypothetical protein
VGHHSGDMVGSKPLPATVSLGRKNFPGTNVLAYLATVSVTEEKSLMQLSPVANVIKIFVRKLQIFVISWSVCPGQAFVA